MRYYHINLTKLHNIKIPGDNSDLTSCYSNAEVIKPKTYESLEATRHFNSIYLENIHLQNKVSYNIQTKEPTTKDLESSIRETGATYSNLGCCKGDRQPELCSNQKETFMKKKKK